MQTFTRKSLAASCFCLLLFSAVNCLAQKITIKKTKGLSAIIDSSVPLEEGESYQLQTASVSTDVNYSTAGLKSRQNSVTLGMNFSTYAADSVQTTQFSLQSRYGWNFSNVEFGVVGQGTYFDDGSGAKTEFTAGGYLDYNLISNRGARAFVYGPFALLTMGSTQKKGGSANILDGNAGGFVSFFPYRGATAFRLEAFLDTQQVTSAVGSANLMGFGSRVLLLYYF